MEQEEPAMTLHIETCPTCEPLYYAAFRSQAHQVPMEKLRTLGIPLPAPAMVVAQSLSTAQPAAPVQSPPIKAGWYKVAFPHGFAWRERGSDLLRQIQVVLSNLDFLRPGEPTVAMQGIMGAEANEPASTVRAAPEGVPLAVTVTVRQNTATGRCRIRVDVELTDAGGFGDLSGITVELRPNPSSMQSSMQSPFQPSMQKTDEYGTVIFDDLPCDIVPSLEVFVTAP
jgi:hypothetical protein